MTSARGGRLRAAALVALAVAAWNGGHAAWIFGKARLAQHLVRRAWEKEKAGAGAARPWPWADTHPVARLVVPGQDVDTFVLAGASGRTMAFGPGHVSGTPLPGEAGNSVVSGHRDTHFAFLRRLGPGDAIEIERRDGQRRRYAVVDTLVVDHRDTWVAEDRGDTRLTLVTCYPFDAIRPGGPLRYVVSAVLADEPHSDRSATSGSTPAARRAGTRQARAPTAASRTGTAVNVRASTLPTP